MRIILGVRMRIYIEKKPVEVPEGTLLSKLAEQQADGGKILLAKVDGKIRELHHAVHAGDDVQFLTVLDKSGYEAMRRTLSMVFFAAVDDVLGEAAKTTLHFTVGDGLFFTIGSREKIDDEICERICRKMKSLIDEDLPIRKRSFSVRAARELFRVRGMADKEALFKTRLPDLVNVYFLGSYADYQAGFIAPSTGAAGDFSLIPYEDGVLLLTPGWKSDGAIRMPAPQPQFFHHQRLGEEWVERRGVGTAGELNELLVRMGARGAILVSEADQERRISDIAEEIVRRKDVRFALIAGPSSSGKTTFSQRLCVQLVAHGVRPHYIGTDNYFIDRDKMPVEKDGSKDYEGLGAIALDVFVRDMKTLLTGGTISLPKFDFITGKRMDSGIKLALGERDVLLIEGIHGLNDALTGSIPKESKFKIYVSALTQLNIDNHNHIPSSDGRLLRRIVRDHLTRGYTADATLRMWESVRKGEHVNIFPFQETVDAFFNSSLPYEPGVLRAYVEPLLFQVPESSPVYIEARRLLKFLNYFLCIPGDDVPTNSILREFIGGGSFRG